MSVKPKPDGYHSVTPYLIVKGAAEALDFYKSGFNAFEKLRLLDPDSGVVSHAEIMIGDSVVMLSEEFPERGFKGPETLGGASGSFLIYVEDVDSLFKKAIQAGAKEMRPVQDQFYGDRSGTLKDPYGHVWTLATHMEDLSDEQIDKRFEEFMKQQK
jgi:PhnB protein